MTALTLQGSTEHADNIANAISSAMNGIEQISKLIPIDESNGKRVVNARDLHRFLGSKQEFANWIKSRIEKYGFIENQDYSSFDNVIKRATGATVRKEYALSIDMAKELSMIENNDKGREARQYFLECEKSVKKRLTNIQMFALQAQINLDIENRMNAQQAQLDNIQSDIQAMKDERKENTDKLLAAPMSDMIVPAESLRGQINELVRNYALSRNIAVKDVWRKVYNRLYYRFHVNLTSRKGKKESKLDIAERRGLLDKVFAAASIVVREGL